MRAAQLVARYEAELVVASVHLAAKLAMALLAFWTIGRPDDYVEKLALAWDGEHFHARATEGYTETSNFAFAPLYPWLVDLLGGSVAAMLIVANAASLVAVVLITRLMGYRAGLFFALFPLWLVYSTLGYSESTFVALAAGALLVLTTARDTAGGALAGLLASAATFARYAGGVAFVALAAWLAPRTRALVGYLAVGAAAAAALLTWHHHAGGSTFVYFDAQDAWSAKLAWPWQHVDWVLHGWFTNQSAVTTHPSVFLWRNAIVWSMAAVGVWLLWQRRLWPLFAYSAPLVLLVVCTVGTPAISLPRLVLAAFPAFAVYGGALTDRRATVAYGLVAVAAATWILVQHMSGSFFA